MNEITQLLNKIRGKYGKDSMEYTAACSWQRSTLDVPRLRTSLEILLDSEDMGDYYRKMRLFGVRY